MKKTLENKAKFFAENLGRYIWDSIDGEFDEKQICYVLSKVDIDGNVWVRHERDNVDHKVPIERLSIVKKPLSQISDEDLVAIEFGNIGNKKVTFSVNNPDYQWRSSCGTTGYLMINHTDYLRSKGYALDWNGITVEEQIEFGWIKLKQDA